MRFKTWFSVILINGFLLLLAILFMFGVSDVQGKTAFRTIFQLPGILTVVQEVSSGDVSIVLKANQSVDVQCPTADEVLITHNEESKSVLVTCRVWVEPEESHE